MPVAWVFGITLIALGLAVSPAAWVDFLRGPAPAELRDRLLLGAAVFRTGLLGLGLFALAGWGLGCWRHGRGPDPGRGTRVDAAVVAILVLACALRLYRLDEGLWLDEILTLVQYVRLPLGEIVTSLPNQNQHVLYSILAHASIGIFGESAWSFRLPAASFGVASVWALYDFARRVVSRRESLFAAALLCVSHHHVWFSQNARGYTGGLFFALLSSSLLLRGLAHNRPRVWLAYGTAVALGGYTHLTMIFVVVAQFSIYLSHLLDGDPGIAMGRWRPLLGGFVFAALLGVTLYGFGIPQFFGPGADRPGVPTWLDPSWALGEALRSFRLDVGPGPALGLAGLAVLGLGCASFWRRRPAVVVLLVLPALGAGAAALAIEHHLWPRTFFLVTGFGLLVLVRGGMVCGGWAARLLKRPEPLGLRFASAATAAVCLLSLASVPSAYGPKQDFVGARDFVERERAAADAVVAVGVARFPYLRLYAPEWQGAGDASELERLRAESRRTWVVSIFPPHLAGRHPDVASLLRSDFRQVAVFPGSLGGGSVRVYREK